MPLTYTGPSGIFTHLGALISRINSYGPIALTTLPADLLTLLNTFGTTWLPEEGIAHAYEGLKDTVTGWRQALAGYCDSRLSDYSTVLTPLGLDSSSGIDLVLPALLRQMVIDAMSVTACTCTAGTPAAVAGNRGNGAGFVTLALDGYNPPVLGAAPSVLYTQEASQFCVPSETMTLECVADSIMSGTSEGGESWTWSGGPAYGDLDYRVEGSGTGPGLQTANSGPNLLVNDSLETWSANVPVGWQLDQGVAGTDLVQESAAANVFRGTTSAKLAGGGAATIQLGQLVSPSLLTGRRRYLIAIAVKASAVAVPATLTVSFAGTGYTASESLIVLGSAFPTSWTLYGAFVTMPAPMPANWEFIVNVTGLPSGVSLWIDSLVLAPAAYHGGVGLAITAGSAPWQRGDRLTFGVTNDQAGKFQSFFRRHYLTQLPSALVGNAGPLVPLVMQLVGGPNIPDGLAS